ncbi:MAG: phage tail protein, partial [Candidatus Thorarchaeota archaeon]
LKLASGLSRQITLKYDGSFSEESDPLGYYVLKPYDSWAEYDGDGEKEYGEAVDRYKTGTLFFVYWVGYFTPAYSPRNYLETTKTSIWASSEHANTEIEQYYICSTVLIDSFEVTNPDLSGNGLIAEYKTYNFQVIIHSTIDYNDINYVQLILDYDTEHEVHLVWTRQVTKDLSSWHPSSYTAVSGDNNFTEGQDYKNIFYFDKSASTVEAYVLNYPNDNTTYVRLTFKGYFMLQHPVRDSQDVKVIAVAYENNEEKTNIFNDAYWVENKPYFTQTSEGNAGFFYDDPWKPYVKNDDMGTYAVTSYYVPNFQHFSLNFHVLSSDVPVDEEWQFYSELHLFKNLERQIAVGIFIDMNLTATRSFTNVEVMYYEHGYYEGGGGYWAWTRATSATGSDFIVRFDANSRTTGNLKIDFWISEDNTQIGVRIQTTEYLSTWSWNDEVGNYTTNTQYFETMIDIDKNYDQNLPLQNYLEADVWAEIDHGICVGLGGITYEAHVETTGLFLKHEKKEGIPRPYLEVPQSGESWGFFEPLRPIVTWFSKVLYALLKPLFDAVVGALTTIWTTVFSALTSLWSVVVQALDTLLYWITGQPNLFSSAITALASWWGNFVNWLTILASNILNIASLIGNALSIIVLFLDKGIKTIAWFVSSVATQIANVISLFWEFFTGTGRFETIGKLSWAILVILAALFPMMYLNHLFSAMRTGGIMGFVERFKDDLLMLKGLFEGFVWVFEYIWQKFREVYGFIKSHIPTMGGT